VVVDDCTMILDEGAEILVAGDDGAIVLQHRGREEEVRCMANPIHSAWRSGSLRRGGFGGGDFENGDDGSFLAASWQLCLDQRTRGGFRLCTSSSSGKEKGVREENR
jgi:hypothetical protein